MTPRLEHETRAQMIVMLTKIAALFEDGVPVDWWQAAGTPPWGFPAGVHVDCSDRGPIRRRPPIPVVSLRVVHTLIHFPTGSINRRKTLGSLGRSQLSHGLLNGPIIVDGVQW